MIGTAIKQAVKPSYSGSRKRMPEFEVLISLKRICYAAKGGTHRVAELTSSAESLTAAS